MVFTALLLVASPFSLAKRSLIFGIRSIFMIIQIWTEMLRAAICVQLTAFWRIIIWATAVLSLPVRALTALQREKMFEMRIHEMQMELENLVWAKKKLDEQLRSAINERRMVEAMLVELEDENEEAVCKMELLEGELHHLRVENQQLKEAQGKSFWSSKIRGEKKMHKDISEDEKIHTSQMQDINKALLQAYGPVQAYLLDKDSQHAAMNNVTLQKREIARSQSFFSAVLTLLVGAIVWEAKDPCMPLVVALFAVVVMSLKTVLVFFSTIRNKPAMDAVFLLSVNWFMLGLLSYPTLPMVAHYLPSLVFSVLGKDGNLVAWFSGTNAASPSLNLL